MAGSKQKDYLADILADDEGGAIDSGQAAVAKSPALLGATTTEAAPRKRGMALLGRDTALARIASGKVRQVTQLQLDPARARIWTGNARIQDRLNEDNVRGLIDSIIAEGGQKVPVVVRHVTDDPAHDYEVIAGTRRHFAISWLRANSYPDMTLLAEVRDLDDEAAFRLADIENRAREDISEIERARNYAEALKSHYGGKQVRMAERLKLSKGWLSKMLKVAALPDRIIAAFPDLSEFALREAYKLAQAMDDPNRSRAILAEAVRSANENNQRLKDGLPCLGGPAIVKRLMMAESPDKAKPVLYEGFSRENRPALSVTSTSRHGMTIKVHAASGAEPDEMVALFREALAQHEYAPDEGGD